MQRRDFAYDLPPELIAQTPLAERSASRLLALEPSCVPVATAPSGASSSPSGVVGAGAHAEAGFGLVKFRDCTMQDFPEFLRPGDLLVFNDTKVVAARLAGVKPSGGRVEIFLERVVAVDEALVQLRASKPIREGLEVTTPGGVVRVLGKEADLWRAKLPDSALEFFEQWGEVPLPPYINRAADDSDRERYQSIFARERGAVAAPTASLHFDPGLIEEIERRGIKRAFVTLHVGAGTFQPLRTDDLDAHVMHAERVTVSADTCSAIEQTRAAGGRIVAIGTTVVRALESAAAAQQLVAQQVGAQQAAAEIATVLPQQGWSGDTRLFIRPGFNFKVTDALLTNFHLPESTLLMLVCAFAGQKEVLAAYQHAVRGRYRFFSYGDAMFLTKARATPEKVST